MPTPERRAADARMFAEMREKALTMLDAASPEEREQLREVLDWLSPRREEDA